MYIMAKKSPLSPLLKYPGGKEKELKHILTNLPPKSRNYYEPFIGGGAAYFAVDADKYFINDLSTELIDMYKHISKQDESFMTKLNQIQHNWDVMSDVIEKHSEKFIKIYLNYKSDCITYDQLNDHIIYFLTKYSDDFNGMLQPNFNLKINNFINELLKSISNKMKRMKKLEASKGDLIKEDLILNIEGAFKSAFYMHFRYLYNNINELSISKSFATAIYFYIREYCYSSMFRYNSNNKFNVPYGGISYNKKSMSKKINYFTNKELVNHLNKTIIGNMDFYDFMKKYSPDDDDFIFLDPPYDTEFSKYANNEFDKNDQKRLSDYLLTECKAYFMIIIKNTEYIRSIYPEGFTTVNGRKLKVRVFDKKYLVSFQDRNDKETQHLLITNY